MMSGHRQNQCNVCDSTRADHSNGANELILVISADKNILSGVGRILGLHRVEAFVEMPERFALPDRCFVVDPDNARDQVIVQLHLLHHHPDSRGLFDGFSFRPVYPSLPPIGIGSDGNDRKIVPFEVIRMSGNDVRQLLSEREDVRLQTTLLQSLDEGWLVDGEFTLIETLVVNGCDFEPRSRRDYGAIQDLG